MVQSEHGKYHVNKRHTLVSFYILKVFLKNFKNNLFILL
jgi:hypothetical protein